MSLLGRPLVVIWAALLVVSCSRLFDTHDQGKGRGQISGNQPGVSRLGSDPREWTFTCHADSPSGVFQQNLGDPPMSVGFPQLPGWKLEVEPGAFAATRNELSSFAQVEAQVFGARYGNDASRSLEDSRRLHAAIGGWQQDLDVPVTVCGVDGYLISGRRQPPTTWDSETYLAVACTCGASELRLVQAAAYVHGDPAYYGAAIRTMFEGLQFPS